MFVIFRLHILRFFTTAVNMIPGQIPFSLMFQDLIVIAHAFVTDLFLPGLGWGLRISQFVTVWNSYHLADETKSFLETWSDAPCRVTRILPDHKIVD